MGGSMGGGRGGVRPRSFGPHGPAAPAWFRPLSGSESSGSRPARHIGRGRVGSFARRHRRWTGPLAVEMRSARRGQGRPDGSWNRFGRSGGAKAATPELPYKGGVPRRAGAGRSRGSGRVNRRPVVTPGQHASTRWCPEPDSNRYAREGQRGLSSPCLHSTIRAGHERRIERSEPIGGASPEQRAGDAMLSYFIDV